MAKYGPKPRPVADKLWERVDQSNPDGCWPWTGGTNPNGYGQVSERYRKFATHRLAWQLTYGPIPDGMFVLHRCDNPPCCRPDHLFLGTQGDNNQDCRTKGRHGHGPLGAGERHHKAKLTEAQVREIRHRRAAGELLKDLARYYGVNHTTISAAASGKTWRDVT